ncbi:MAG TPA: hypothetical protein VJW73_16375 [Gemmatimonadaceae bacterium]|nr:hypothetical protein [Gemmatimonadaceae bacterium]
MIRSHVAAVLAAALGTTAFAAAGAQCRPPASSHEARLLAFYEAPVLFSMGSAPERLAAGALRIGGEAIPVPSPDQLLTHPSFCYQYTTNNTKLAPLFGRPRIVVGLPAGFAFEGSYVPPVSVSSARVTIGSLALSQTRSFSLGGAALLLQARAHGTLGRIHGPITCPRGSLQLQDEAAPCYGTTPSRDSYDPRSLGAELAASAQFGRLDVFAGGGANRLDPRFRAGFTDALGNVDHTTVDVALVRGVAFGGATLHLRHDLTVSGQLYVVPADVSTVRLGVAYRVR